MQQSQIVQLVVASLSADSHSRTNAQTQLERMQQENLASFLLLLSQELANESLDLFVRSAIALILKNSLSSKDHQTKLNLQQHWISILIDNKSQIKSNLLLAIQSQDIKVGIAAAQAVAAIAEIELPRNEWQELMPCLLNTIANIESSPSGRQASLQAIGFICESVNQDCLKIYANQILTAVAQGARKEETNDQIRLAALQAFYNSLEFVRDNFENEGERNYIMQIVCEATQGQNVDVQVAAYESLVKIVSLYYDKMPMYMQKALFGLTISGMKHENERIALQAVEFWSTVCEEEIDIEEDLLYAYETGDDTSQYKKNYHFANAALQSILPVLLYLLTLKDEDDDEDEWKISMGAATCLSLFAFSVKDDVVQPVLTFVETNIKSPDWKLREAAVMAFGSILEGPNQENLGKLVQTALPVLIELVSDQVVQVKDTAAWTLGKVCELLMEYAQPLLPQLVEVLIKGLGDSNKVAANCAWSMINISVELSAENNPTMDTYALSQYFDQILSSLMACAELQNQENIVRSTCYEAIGSFVANCADDCLATVQNLTVAIIARLEQTIAMQDQLVNSDDRRQHGDLQANLCSVLTNIVRRLGTASLPVCDRIMELLCTIMSNSSKTSSTLLEDCFLTVGAVCGATEGNFVRYMETFTPFLFAALQNHEDYAMCSIAVGTVGDVCRALNESVLPFCDGLMNVFMTNLQSTVLHRNVKPVILSSFGDIALAIGSKFEKYLQTAMVVLEEAAKSSVQMSEDPELFEYAGKLREGIVEAYVGIVQGIKSSENPHTLSPYIPTIFSFLQHVGEHPERTESGIRSTLGLLGDLAETFPQGSMTQFFGGGNGKWIEALIKEVKFQKMGSATRDVSKWAKEMIKKQV